MCGIVGMVSPSPLPEGWGEDLQKMNRALTHRGPDDFGYFWEGPALAKPLQTLDAQARPRAAFGHRRLSILDLSEAARQPMVREKGKIFLAYNGEIYNFRELREELTKGGAVFQTASDTEVFLEAYRAWGIQCVEKLRGIFAFALADLRKNRVFLARDHLGVKPLYYTRRSGLFYFASELKAFLTIKHFEADADFDALRQYLQFLWIPGEQTGLKNIFKLEPATLLTFDLNTGETSQSTYWSPFDCRGERQAGGLPALRENLARAVREELVSDVPLGAFLSGGLDSSLVVALMQKTHQTFSIGYRKEDLAFDIVPDDLPFARQVSRALQIPHQEILLSPNVGELLPKVVWHLDEPLGDPAAVSSYLICEAAKKNGLTVMLSGMGGDELFAGYPRQKALVYAQYFRKMPKLFTQTIQCLSDSLPGAGKSRRAKWGRSLKKFLKGMDGDSLQHYIAMESYFLPTEHPALLAGDGPWQNGAGGTEATHQKITNKINGLSPIAPLRQALLLDLVTYLPCLNLAYTDKTSMANGIEVRVPFLDIELVRLALQQAPDRLLRWRRGKLEGKWLLKKAAEPFLPSRIIWRKKAGFGAPVRSWLRGGLREMQRELLGANGLGKRGWFQKPAILKLQEEFFSGKEDHALKIWMLMSLELWTRQYIDR
ncbi:MAG: asparagine synthase (glutamine-hydrolyzing) [Deltaproteobacteria bacterium]|nr:asparagine synthase (glutamine-hydrolyzing) [Deltaproteobacteria bacterium]MBI4223339.1 asparagine synthase (glutamine-hydrolyzing) [Deltaproteobacteria bacterium]